MASLLPGIGILFGLIGLVVGLVALVTISRRQLPRLKGVAIAGVVLPFLGFLVTAGLIFLTAKN